MRLNITESFSENKSSNTITGERSITEKVENNTM
jgi:hypothetical protein